MIWQATDHWSLIIDMIIWFKLLALPCLPSACWSQFLLFKPERKDRRKENENSGHPFQHALDYLCQCDFFVSGNFSWVKVRLNQWIFSLYSSGNFLWTSLLDKVVFRPGKTEPKVSNHLLIERPVPVCSLCYAHLLKYHIVSLPSPNQFPALTPFEPRISLLTPLLGVNSSNSQHPSLMQEVWLYFILLK